jgi:hypothetical protein
MEKISSQLFVMAFAICALGVFFNFLNQKKHPRKKLAWPKLFWLCFIVINFFAYPFYFYFFTELNALTLPLAALGGFCLLRLPFQLIMVKVLNHWKPLYAVFHSLAALAFFVLLNAYFIEAFQFYEGLYAASLSLAMALAVSFAWLDHKHAGSGRPYALLSPNLDTFPDSKRKKTLRVAFFANVILYTVMFCFVYLY